MDWPVLRNNKDMGLDGLPRYFAFKFDHHQ